MPKEYHVPVLLTETIELLDPKPKKVYIDATLGGGGHAEAILKSGKGQATLIGIDRDREAIAESRKRLEVFSGNVRFVQGNFSDIKNIMAKLGIGGADGILFDLGVSSHQLEEGERGFSVSKDGPLDMRMDKSEGPSAEVAVNSLERDELSRIFYEFGEERNAKRIARHIVEGRPLSTTKELAETIRSSLRGLPPKVIFDATIRIFQALRIYVNGELSALPNALKGSIDVLNSGGVIVVISYHSLEDRIVKDAFRLEAADCICPPKQPICTCDHRKRLSIITKKPITAGNEEVSVNPRSRSAKLRAAQRI